MRSSLIGRCSHERGTLQGAVRRTWTSQPPSATLFDQGWVGERVVTVSTCGGEVVEAARWRVPTSAAWHPALVRLTPAALWVTELVPSDGNGPARGPEHEVLLEAVTSLEELAPFGGPRRVVELRVDSRAVELDLPGGFVDRLCAALDATVDAESPVVESVSAPRVRWPQRLVVAGCLVVMALIGTATLWPADERVSHEVAATRRSTTSTGRRSSRPRRPPAPEPTRPPAPALRRPARRPPRRAAPPPPRHRRRPRRRR